jgi:DNA-binding NarL/FixJ family response regulator
MVADLVVIESTRSDRGTALEEALLSRGRVLLTGHFDVDSMLLLLADAGESVVVFDGYPSASALRRVSDAVEGNPGLAVVVIGSVASSLDVLVALASGVSGYVAEPGEPAAVAAAVDGVLRGELSLPPGMSRDRVRATLTGLGPVTVDRPDGRPVSLTRPEWEVLILLRQGRTIREIADRLDIAPATARRYAYALLPMLGRSSRGSLAVDGVRTAGGGCASAVS